MEASFDKFLKRMNPATLSFSLIDLLLGLLAITYIDFAVPAVLSSTTTLIIVLTVYLRFNKLKTQTTEIKGFLEKYAGIGKAYGVSSIVLSVLDILFGVLFILSLSVAFASMSVISGTAKIIVVGGRVIHLKKAQNFARTAGIISLGYAGFRNKKFLLEVKKMFKKLFSVLNSNKISLLLSGTGIAALADAMLGSPVLSDIFALFGVDALPLWAKSLTYLIVLVGSLAGVKWEKVEEFANRVSQKKADAEKYAIEKAKAKQELVFEQEAKKLLEEKQKKELEELKAKLKAEKEATTNEKSA